MIRVCEIFHSIQGESTYAGMPCTFIRLTGCNLRCTYCDTSYAFDEGEEFSIQQIIEKVDSIGCHLVEITGGEPLLQRETSKLCDQLFKKGYEVLAETNGSFNIDWFPRCVKRIVDIKCPGSGESEKMDWQNLNRLRVGDEIKFVLQDRADYDWAKAIPEKFLVPKLIPIHFSPVPKALAPKKLAKWILEDGINIRLQMQLHKIIWPEVERGR